MLARLLINSASVSYTHLDVYKRQRFQTFPDWFVFRGGLIAAGEQIGNAVPIRLGEILLRTVVAGIEMGLREIESRTHKDECLG